MFSRILGCSRDSKLYTIMKWSCAVNALGQLFFMSWFIADWNINWAYEVNYVYFIYNIFPFFSSLIIYTTRRLLLKVLTFLELLSAMCQNWFVYNIFHMYYVLKEMGQAHNYTFQCVLMFNFVNEKIFLFLYIWVIFLLVVNVISAMRFVWIIWSNGIVVYRQTLILVCPPFRIWIAQFVLPVSFLLD